MAYPAKRSGRRRLAAPMAASIPGVTSGMPPAAIRCKGEGGITSVHAYPQGASPYGVLEMAGNASEWTRSLWGRYPYPSDAKGRAQREDLQALNDQARVDRSGVLFGVRCAWRDGHDPDILSEILGFRVVMHP